MLQIGQIVNNEYKVMKQIGVGGQGSVYQVRQVSTGEDYALKWYMGNKVNAENKNRLKQLAEKGPPSHHFIWPIEIVTDTNQGFGYIMPLLESVYCDVTDYFDNFDPMLYTTVNACFELSEAFAALHFDGYIYGDISYTNIFINPKTGSVKIIDNDNVTPRGILATRILTPDFAAPELIVNQKYVPKAETDLHSLAIILFHILTAAHPLRGISVDYYTSREGTDAEFHFLGENPVYIFDSENESNRPHNDGIIHKTWPLYPLFMKERFKHTFTTGLKNPTERTNTSLWKQTFFNMLDSIYHCSCGAELIFDYDDPEKKCPRCNIITKPLILHFRNNKKIVANNQNYIYPHHLNNNFDYSIVLGRFENDSESSAKVVLRNNTNSDWQLKTAEGNIESIPPNSTTLVSPRSYIRFGINDTFPLARIENS